MRWPALAFSSSLPFSKSEADLPNESVGATPGQRCWSRALACRSKYLLQAKDKSTDAGEERQRRVHHFPRNGTKGR